MIFCLALRVKWQANFWQHVGYHGNKLLYRENQRFFMPQPVTKVVIKMQAAHLNFYSDRLKEF